MNILLIGEAFSENLGDSIICETVKRIVEEQYSDINIITFDISGKINYQDFYKNNTNKITKKICCKIEKYLSCLLRLSKAYRDYKKDERRYSACKAHFDDLMKKTKIDAIIFAGGEMFMDYFLHLIYYIVKKARKNNINVIFHACGVCNYSLNYKSRLKKILNSKNVLSVSVRDGYEELLPMLKNCDKLVDTYDTALCCSEYNTDSNISPSFDYGLGVINIEKYYDVQKNFIKKFIESDISFKIFVNGGSWDYKFACEILEDLGVEKQQFSKYLLPRPTTSMELINIIKSFSFIISYRLHSQIVAASFGIASFGFVWDDKVKTFYDKLEMKNNYMMLKDEESDIPIDYFDKFKIFNVQNKVIEAAQATKQNLLDQVEILLESEKYDT